MNEMQGYISQIDKSLTDLPDIDVLADVVDRLHDHVVNLRIDDRLGHEKYVYLVTMINHIELAIYRIQESQQKLRELTDGFNIVADE